jgi:RNA polymerase sigma factor (TIGR02999 family)
LTAVLAGAIHRPRKPPAKIHRAPHHIAQGQHDKSARSAASDRDPPVLLQMRFRGPESNSALLLQKKGRAGSLCSVAAKGAKLFETNGRSVREDMEPSPVTALLQRWRAGEEGCLDQLIPLLERELREIAHRYMRAERPNHTLQTTALINEAFLKLMQASHPDWQSRAHFMGLSAQLMRHILIDHARGLSSQKRGGAVVRIPLEEDLVFSPEKAAGLIALDEALIELAKFDARKARVVELRYFGGMSVEEVSEVLGVHPNTVIRDWQLSRNWLKRELRRGER